MLELLPFGDSDEPEFSGEVFHNFLRDLHDEGGAAFFEPTGGPTPPTCSGARRARVPAGGCVPERATPGAPGRSGVPAQPPDAVPATHTLEI